MEYEERGSIAEMSFSEEQDEGAGEEPRATDAVFVGRVRKRDGVDGCVRLRYNTSAADRSSHLTSEVDQWTLYSCFILWSGS